MGIVTIGTGSLVRRFANRAARQLISLMAPQARRAIGAPAGNPGRSRGTGRAPPRLVISLTRIAVVTQQPGLYDMQDVLELKK